MMATQLTEYERKAYLRIIETGEASLRRHGPTAPLAGFIANNVADARRKLAGVAA